MKIDKLSIDKLKFADYNPRKDLKPGDPEYEKLKNSIEHFGYVEPVIVNDRTGLVVGGHQRVKVLKDLGYTEIEVVHVDLDEANEKALNVALNKISGDWDAEKLEDLLRELNLNDDIDVLLTGFDTSELDTLFSGSLGEDEDDSEGYTDEVKESYDKNKFDKDKAKEYYSKVEHTKSLKDRYSYNPFSVLNTSILYTSDSHWCKAVKWWKDLIKDKGEGRPNATVVKAIGGWSNTVSILDPALCELVCKWFLPAAEGNKVFDTFAGDTVFGFVSSFLGNNFTGIELREEQAEYNNKRVTEFGLSASYICDDALNVLKHFETESQDLYFSCPPYYDLEVYSDKENDASNQATYEDFYSILDRAFTDAVKCLKENRFAVIVCGDIRNKKTGEYYDFPGDIKRTFKNAGCILYNELILCNKIGSAVMRANNQMRTRKIVKVHQNVLVFYKGDTSKIKEEFPSIDFGPAEYAKFDLDTSDESPDETVKDTFEIVEMSREDMDSVCKLWNKHSDVLHIPYKDKIETAIKNNNAFVLKNSLGIIGGFIIFKKIEKRNCGKITELCVDEKYRHSGLGLKLVKYFVDNCDNCDFYILEAIVGADNNSFYNKFCTPGDVHELNGGKKLREYKIDIERLGELCDCSDE